MRTHWSSTSLYFFSRPSTTESHVAWAIVKPVRCFHSFRDWMRLATSISAGSTFLSLLVARMATTLTFTSSSASSQARAPAAGARASARAVTAHNRLGCMGHGAAPRRGPAGGLAPLQGVYGFSQTGSEERGLGTTLGGADPSRGTCGCL